VTVVSAITMFRQAGRVISVPEGMTMADALRMVGGFSGGELAEIAALHPRPVGCWDLFSLKR